MGIETEESIKDLSEIDKKLMRSIALCGYLVINHLLEKYPEIKEIKIAPKYISEDKRSGIVIE